MGNRKSISKSIRFEVFKRDKFTCQYCGGKAPDVVLEVDHIHPVSKGGGNDLVNLITSCKSCNSGKKDRVLSDETVVGKQRLQLEELQEMKEQRVLMSLWRMELLEEKEEEWKDAVCYFNMVIQRTGRHLNENGESKIRDVVKKFGLSIAYDAIDVARDSYFREENADNIGHMLDKIPGCAFNIKKSQEDPFHMPAVGVCSILKKRKLIGYHAGRDSPSWKAAYNDVKSLLENSDESLHDELKDLAWDSETYWDFMDYAMMDSVR